MKEYFILLFILCLKAIMFQETNEDCPEKCKKCDNETLKCLECDDNFDYGDYCDKTCGHCLSGCLITGECNSQDQYCKDYQYYGDFCNEECQKISNECKQCFRNETCMTCSDDFTYGDRCDKTCQNCLNGCSMNGKCNGNENCKDDLYYGDYCNDTCQTINNNCATCNKNGTCITCKGDFTYGDHCDKTCDKCTVGCAMNGKCNGTDYCKDKLYYGDFCESECKEINKNCSTCYKNGTCIECSGDFIFGDYCNQTCSNCLTGCTIDGKCYETEEYCKDHLYYGDYCNNTCQSINENCTTCNKNGTCITCKGDFTYGDHCDKTCDKCTIGCAMDGKCNGTEYCKDKLYFGDYCNNTCKSINESCNTCNKNGTCITCSGDFKYGPYCNQICANCLTGCTMDGKCNTKDIYCKNNKYFGEYCNHSCTENNINCTTCYRNKTCITCNNSESYGDSCENLCETCYKGKCHMTGKCIDTEKCSMPFYYNEYCKEDCRDRCSSEDYCDIKGKCKTHCKIGRYKLPLCNEVCPSNCKNSNCTEEGICIGCEDETKYKEYCNTSIESVVTFKNCETVTQYGEECIKCKNNLYYDKTCDKECNIGCEKNEKGEATCFKDGRCENGCVYNYFDTYCDKKCDGCLEKGCDDQGYCKEFKCQEGKYGLKCDQNCTCNINSNSLECGKFSKECLNCKFGYFGVECEKQCNYKCKTGLCCIFYDKSDLNGIISFDTNYKYLLAKIGGHEYTIEIDYNYGFPLTLFNSSEKINCSNINNATVDNIEGVVGPFSIYNFTNYIINGFLYKNSSYSINGQKIDKVDLIIGTKVTCKSDIKQTYSADGVIGLGFFNSISNSLFVKESNKDKQNILSYSIIDKDKTKFSFGTMAEEQFVFIDKLTWCNVLFDSDTDIQGKKMTCKLDGMKSSKHSKAFKLNNATVTFSLGEKSSFILKYDEQYKKYLEQQYFNDNAEFVDGNDGYYYFLYEQKDIHKLSNFGFVFNNFSYSYEPNLLFGLEMGNGKSKFMIKLSKNVEKSELVLGKEFLENIIITINNEEGKIYFYAQNAEFSDAFEDNIENSSFSLQLGVRQTAGICLTIVIVINIIAFVIYFFLKKRKMNSKDYIKFD